MSHKILVINPGSTSTKIAVFEDENKLFEETLRHTIDELAPYHNIPDQTEFRTNIILDCFKKRGFDGKTLDAISCRGGVLRPIPSGTYSVNDAMVKDCFEGARGQHASNLGALVSDKLSKMWGVPAYTVDPTVVDELIPVARYTGNPKFVRESKFHCLNQKAVARSYAKSIGRRYDEINVIVCHMGGGNSVGAHCKGRVVDVENALDGEGPFSAERSGGLPIGDVIRTCFSGEYTQKEVYSMVVGKGGMVAYTGVNDLRVLTEKANEGRREDSGAARRILLPDRQGDRLQVHRPARPGRPDHPEPAAWPTARRPSRPSPTSSAGSPPVTVYPGEMEMLALAQGVLRVMNGEEKALEY